MVMVYHKFCKNTDYTANADTACASQKNQNLST